jgi:hypothetical protein
MSALGKYRWLPSWSDHDRALHIPCHFAGGLAATRAGRVSDSITGGVVTMETSTPAAASARTGWQSVLHRWPSLLGLAAAVMVLATAADRETVAITMCVAALCYLGAAALGRPWVGWAGVVGGSLVVFASGWIGLPWWAGIGIAALALVVVGFLVGVSRPTLTAQTAALIGFGGLAVVAVFIAPRVGLALAGAVLASHAVWDLIHYRRRIVVSRSLAEFCLLLDVPLGVGVIVLAIIN